MLIVTVELPPALAIVLGAKLADAPAGRPDAVSDTVWLLPLVRVELTVAGPAVAPGVAVTDEGFAESVKSSATGADTVSVTVTLAVDDDSPVPVTLT
ncbi:MAG TPA: hypothetical protein VKB75_09070 [Jatrophihabitans sp.]|nr:hypothetical protein [Jatrophihabitans sp.]